MTYLRWKNTLNRMIIILPDYTHITTYYYKHFASILFLLLLLLCDVFICPLGRLNA